MLLHLFCMSLLTAAGLGQDPIAHEAGCGSEPACFHGSELTLLPVVIAMLLIRIGTAEL